MGRIVSFIGRHNSGKTTVGVEVVKYLQEKGYRVAVIKSSGSEKAVFDTEGKDTMKYQEAGAKGVMFMGPDKMVIQDEKRDLSLHTLAHRYFPDADIIICEGFKYARQIPKIEIVRDKEHLLKGKISNVIAMVTDLDIVGDNIFRTTEKKELAMFIEKRFLQIDDEKKEFTTLLVNGQKVHVNRFIQRALGGSVAGLISSLKLRGELKEIELRIKM